LYPKVQRWKAHWDRFSQRHLTWVLGAACASLMAGSFLKITFELQQDDLLHQIDLIILAWVHQFRTPFLTKIALDITALGSPALLALACILVIVVLFRLTRDRHAIMQMVVASIGASAWVTLGKHLIGRSRPEVSYALVVSQGFSYPSGHAVASSAIYLTAGILLSRSLNSRRKRWAVMGIAIALVVLIGLTRIYLGVHYPSDVVGGLLLGAAWALFLEAGATYLKL
jgi:undecaprenyl-diphosphatase